MPGPSGPEQVAEQRTPLPRTDELLAEPPEGELLATGEYGLERVGERFTPTLILRDLRCQSAGTLEVVTDEGTFLVQLRAVPQWTCTDALAQARRSAGSDPAGVKVGLMYREAGASDFSQVNLIFGNGASVLYAARGLYRAG